MADTHDMTGGQAAAPRLTTSAYRRLDGPPSRDLTDAVDGHIRLIQTLTRTAASDTDQARLATAGSSVASFAGWLAWDKGDHGSARPWYGGAVKAARTFPNPLLTAYQIGTLAQFEAHAGNGVEALNPARRARRVLSDKRPAVADAWLLSVKALKHAVAGDRRSADQALTASHTTA